MLRSFLHITLCAMIGLLAFRVIAVPVLGGNGIICTVAELNEESSEEDTSENESDDEIYLQVFPSVALTVNASNRYYPVSHTSLLSRVNEVLNPPPNRG